MTKSNINVPFVRSPYNYDTMAASNESGLDASHDGRTKQEFTQECDLNYIMDRHLSGGDLVFNANPRQPIWGADVTGAPASYHEALNFIKDTERSFMGLDANVRARFDNDPQNFLNFVDDESNYEDAKKLGLLDPAYVAARDKLSGLSPEANSRPQEAGEFESGGNPTPQPKNAPRASKKED